MELETLTINAEAWTVMLGTRVVDLTYQEFRLLLFLAEHQERVFQRAELLREVWADDADVSDRSVDLYVHRLRNKLGGFGRRAIQTVVRVGYRFEVRSAGALQVVQGPEGTHRTAPQTTVVPETRFRANS